MLNRESRSYLEHVYIKEVLLVGDDLDKDSLRTCEEAMASHHTVEWLKAMDQEWATLVQKGTFQEEDLLLNQMPICCKWSFKSSATPMVSSMNSKHNLWLRAS